MAEKTFVGGHALKQQIADWIDTHAIADTLVDIMAEEAPGAYPKITFANGKKIWLDFLEKELSDGLKNSARFVLTGSWRGGEAPVHLPPHRGHYRPRQDMTKQH